MDNTPTTLLEEHISKTMGWWSPNGYDAYPEKTDKVMQLFATQRNNLLAELLEEIDSLKQDERPTDPETGSRVETYGYEENHNQALDQVAALIRKRMV